jgi:heat shock protein HslJ
MHRFVPLALAASLLAACASPPPFEPTAPSPAPAPAAPSGFDAASLAGSVWNVVDVKGIPLKLADQVKLQFASATEVAGFGGCNSFTGRAELSGASIKFGPLAATQRACPPQAMAEESMYFSALGKVGAAREDDGQLVLLDDAGNALVRLKPGN